MAKIVTLKDNNNGIVYPITPVDGVFVDSNTTLADALDDKAEADLSNISAGAITGTKIANNTITATNIDLSTLGGNYSLSEQDTGYTWIDGRHIYKKTIDMGNLPSSATSKLVAHNISNLDRVIKLEGVYKDSSGYQFPVNATTNEPGSIRTIVASANIQVNVGMDRSALSGYVTLYYVKSS